MIVEFIGCAGAGKTTLRRLICERGIPGSPVLAMPDLLLDRPVARKITHPTAVNVVQELGGLPSFLRAWRTERDFIAFARRMLASHGLSTYDRLNGMRGIVRKVGMYELARHRAHRTIVLSDEGTLLSAYNLLVTTRVALDLAEIERFARLVPVPDAVVYVKAPIATLVERAVSRPDPRRQHVGRDTSAVELDVRRTVEMFDLLVTASTLQGRVTVVDNVDQGLAGRHRLADKIVDRLRNLPSREPGSGGSSKESSLSRTAPNPWA